MANDSQESQTIELIADIDAERIDAFLVRKIADLESPKIVYSRSRIQKLITDGWVLVNDKKRKKNFSLSIGDKLIVEIPPEGPQVVAGQRVEFKIIHEDDHLLAVSKPAGVITHPTEQIPTGTLVNGLIGKGIELAPAGGEYRPGVVHRLDKDTSGILLFAKTDQAYYDLVKIFKDREIEKFYRAIVIGNMRDLKGGFDLNIHRHPSNRTKMAVTKTGGKEARTDYQVLERFAGFDSLRVQIHTGRTHQIRVHLAYSGRSVLNDDVYGTKKITEHIRWLGQRGLTADKIGKLMTAVRKSVESYEGMFLHAETLKFRHPITKIPMELTADIPPAYADFLQILRENAQEELIS